MRPFVAALGLVVGLITVGRVSPGFTQTPPSQLPGAEPGKAEAPSEGLPTQGTASTVTPMPGTVAVHFAPGSATIAAEAQRDIDRLASLCAAGQAGMVMLIGYADNPGDPRQDIALGVRRAEAVMSALLKEGKLQRTMAWQVSAETRPDRGNGAFREVVGQCR